MTSRKLGLVLALAVAGHRTIVWAQGPTALPASAVAASAAASESTAGDVRLLVGRSTVVDIGTAIARVSLTDADVADAMVTSPSQLLINGKMPGTISMFVWDRGGALKRYEVVVQRDLARLSEQMKQLFPSEKIEVRSNGKNVVLSGSVSNKDVIEKAVNVAAGYVDKREEVVTLLQLQAGAPSNQVLLRVRFAEVSRNAVTELGASLFMNGYKDGRWFGRSSTQQFPAPQWDQDGKLVFSDFLNLFFMDATNGLGGVIKALQTKGLYQSLAEPNLVAESGKEASFLAGGEFPIPVVQGSGATMAISVVFKEYGVRLNFMPTVNGDRVHLKVRPEVSALDFANGVVINGFRIPALTTRRTETEIELQNGQSFAISGLINNSMSTTMQKIPGIGDIPILGLLFKSKAAQKDQTELVVMITPEILPNNSRGVTPNLPKLQEPFLPPLVDPKKPVTPPPPAFGAVVAPVAAVAAAPGAPVVPVTPVSSIGPATPVVSAAAQQAPSTAAPMAPAAMPAPAAPPAPVSKDAAKRAEEQAKAEERARKHEAELAAKDKESQERLAKEQAKKDQEAAKKAGEAARRQAEIDREKQKAIEAAAAKLRAAEAQYNAELEKTGKAPQKDQ
jgi:pilus assembly protein CpaC